MRKSLCLAVVAGLVIAVVAQTPHLYFSDKYPQQVSQYPLPQQASIVADGVLTVNNKVNLLARKTGERFDNDENRISALEDKTGTVIQYIKALEEQKVRQRIDDLEGQLKDFRTVMCPLVKNSKVKDDQKDQIEKVCPTDSDTHK
jgi:hypothetical protein